MTTTTSVATTITTPSTRYPLTAVILAAVLFQTGCGPPSDSKDPRERLRAVSHPSFTDSARLLRIAATDPDTNVALAAVAKLPDDTSLAWVARQTSNSAVAHAAGCRITNDLLRAGLLDELPDAALRTILLKSWQDTPLLERTALHHQDPETRLAAIASIHVEPSLVRILTNSTHIDVQIAALKRLHDEQLITQTAIEGRSTELRAAALRRLSNAPSLLSVALTTRYSDSAVTALRALQGDEDRYRVASAATDARVRTEAAALVGTPALAARLATSSHDVDVRLAAVRSLARSCPAAPAQPISAAALQPSYVSLRASVGASSIDTELQERASQHSGPHPMAWTNLLFIVDIVFVDAGFCRVAGPTPELLRLSRGQPLVVVQHRATTGDSVLVCNPSLGTTGVATMPLDAAAQQFGQPDLLMALQTSSLLYPASAVGIGLVPVDTLDKDKGMECGRWFSKALANGVEHLQELARGGADRVIFPVCYTTSVTRQFHNEPLDDALRRLFRSASARRVEAWFDLPADALGPEAALSRAASDSSAQVAAAALEALRSDASLVTAALRATSPTVALQAEERIRSEDALLALGLHATDTDTRKRISSRISNDTFLGRLGLRHRSGVDLSTITNGLALLRVAKWSDDESMRAIAIRRVRSEHQLIDLAATASSGEEWLIAFARLESVVSKAQAVADCEEEVRKVHGVSVLANSDGATIDRAIVDSTNAATTAVLKSARIVKHSCANVPPQHTQRLCRIVAALVVRLQMLELVPIQCNFVVDVKWANREATYRRRGDWKDSKEVGGEMVTIGVSVPGLSTAERTWSTAFPREQLPEGVRWKSTEALFAPAAIEISDIVEQVRASSRASNR